MLWGARASTYSIPRRIFSSFTRVNKIEAMFEARNVKIEQGSTFTWQPPFPRKHCTLPMTPERNYSIFLLISGISEIPI